MPALVHAMTFAESRLRVIAENVANVHTPGYRAKSLDPKGFQGALRRALEVRGGDVGKPLVIDDGRQLRTDSAGRLQVRPSEQPVQNVLFHDETNLSLERQMSDLAETGMMHELAATLLRGSVDRLRGAIRGSVA
jgi:flagellar basal-body rod protein FlgB